MNHCASPANSTRNAILAALLAAGSLAAVPLPALGEGPNDPEIGYVFPSGGPAGKTVEVRLGIYEYTPDLQLFVDSESVRLEVTGQAGPLLLAERPHPIGPKAYGPLPLPREVPARFAIPPDTPAGPVRWQIANANGSSRTGVFIVSRDRETLEDEDLAAPQEAGSLPVTISGRLRKNEEVDRYTVRRDSPGPITCELFARRLGSPFRGVIEVRDAAGRLIAEAVDTQGIDVACTFFAEKQRPYTVAVRDLDYLGNRAFCYRLHLAAGPRVVATMPGPSMAGWLPVRFIGFGLATGAARLEEIDRDVQLPSGDSAFGYRLVTPFGSAQPVRIDANAPARASLGLEAFPISVPGANTTRFEGELRTRRYRFLARKGDRLDIQAASRATGSSLDLDLTVVGPDGKEAHNDDLPGTLDAGLEFVATSDGWHEARVTDQSARSDWPRVFRFSVERARLDFTLEAPQRIAIVLGEKAELAVKANRTGGFNGPIRLSVSGLPEGVRVASHANELVIPPDKTEGRLMLVSDPAGPALASVARIDGTATLDGREITHPALAPAGDSLAPVNPAANRTSRLLVTTLLKPRVRIWPVESDERTVHRGTIHLAELGIERLEGFQGDVYLRLESRQPNKFRQGILGPDLLVKPGETRVMYPCFVGEEAETVDAYRLSVNALAKVRDPKGHERWLVSSMRSQVSVALTVEGGLMKVTAQGDGLRLRPNSRLAIPLRVLRSAKLALPAQVTLQTPPQLSGLVSAEPLDVPFDREAASLVVHVQSGPLPPGRHTLHIRARALQAASPPRLADLGSTPLDRQSLDALARGLLPVVSETAVEVEADDIARSRR
jgi:hypothetical protein